MKEYTIILKRTLTNPEIVIMFRGTMVACQHYMVFNRDAYEIL